METLYYDGGCGLCHATVKFVLRHDRDARFRFAPIGGASFTAAFAGAVPAPPTDSVIVRTADGRTFVRSTAVAHILGTLGGAWRLTGRVLRVVPRPLRDAGYRGVAAIRRRVFAPPGGACPVVPQELRSRFLP